MTSKLTSICVCSVLALSVGPVKHADASSPGVDESSTAPDASSTPVLGLLIDTTEIDEDYREQLEATTTAMLRPALETAGFTIADGSVDMILRVRFAPYDGGDFRDHGIHFELIKGESVTPAIQWVICAGCGRNRLEKSLEAATPELLDALNDVFELPDSKAPTGDGDGDVSGSLNTPPPPKPIGLLGGIGIGVAVAGVGLTVAGAVQWSRGRILDDDINSKLSEGRDFTPQGRAFVGIGAGVIVVGAVMLGVDMGLRAKKRRTARAQVLPAIGPEHTGLLIQGRF
jgi:hypothetical protein